MKKILALISSITLFVFTACNNNQSSKEEKNTVVNKDTTIPAPVDSTISVVNHSFADVDKGIATSMNAIVEYYLAIKNALVDKDGPKAALAARALGQEVNKVDKSLLTAGQAKVYKDIEEDLKEHAEHIGDNGDKIEHQRMHFAMMSDVMYELAKSFGGGRSLYHDHCPMANDNKGAMWLSEMKEVKNPYFGGKMNECVTVMEVIK